MHAGQNLDRQGHVQEVGFYEIMSQGGNGVPGGSLMGLIVNLTRQCNADECKNNRIPK